MPGKVILGAQWGDEGKGKFIDIFAGKADLVVRSQGGNNAGHTVVAGGEKYKLQLIPSGILYPECVNVIGPGVVVNPKAVLGEIDGLHEKGVSTDKLFIDAMYTLHDSCKDPLEVITWREIYLYLEKCVDTCEHVADVVESVVMKNS